MVRFDSEDVHVAALTLIGEARGEDRQGMLAIAWVVRNRCEDGRWPDRPASVAREELQFSAWNMRENNVGNLHRMLHAGFNDPLYRTARAIAAAAFEGLLDDPTGGANHYHTRAINPGWADSDKETARLGDHVFYRL